jgi:D-alanyl-D-alanine carboxypeptidase (penicillin-binding protein 5/6)
MSARAGALCGWLAGLAVIAPVAGGARGPTPVGVADPYPGAGAAYAVALDARLLWGHRIDRRLQPASLAKLLTAVVLLGPGWRPDAWLTISTRAARVPSPRIGLRPGERIRAGAALQAMLVHSANDACRALVEQSAPSRAAFAARMNEHAAALGLRHSHFVDPCGFDAPGQYTTARDLLLLARIAYAERRIAGTVSRDRVTVVTGAGRRVELASTNQLIGRLDGVVGIKTGYTAQAGECLIALAERSGHRVWLVILDSRERWWFAHRMIADAFQTLSLTAYRAPGS